MVRLMNKGLMYIKSLDLTNLTTDQLERLAKGDNIYDVLANKG